METRAAVKASQSCWNGWGVGGGSSRLLENALEGARIVKMVWRDECGWFVHCERVRAGSIGAGSENFGDGNERRTWKSRTIGFHPGQGREGEGGESTVCLSRVSWTIA